MASAIEQANPNTAFQEIFGQRTTACPLSRSLTTLLQKKICHRRRLQDAALLPPRALPERHEALSVGKVESWNLETFTEKSQKFNTGPPFRAGGGKGPFNGVVDTLLPVTFGSISVSFCSYAESSFLPLTIKQRISQHRDLNPSDS